MTAPAAAAGSVGTRRAWRWPALALLVGLVGAGLVVERAGAPASPTVAAEPLEGLLPTVAGSGAKGSTWLCPGGTATGSGDAEVTVSVLNAGSAPAEVRLTAMADGGDRGEQIVTLDPATRVDVAASDLLDAPWAGVLVEADRGEVAVEQRVTDGEYHAVAACASRASDRWSVPFGTTRAGTRMVMLVFNPFPDDAVIDVRFQTDDGARTPEEYRPKLVRGGHVAALEVTDVVTLRQQVAAVVEARAGRVAVATIGWWDGTDGAPAGLTLTPAAPRLADTWAFALGSPTGSVAIQEVVAFNDADGDAVGEVLVEGAATGAVEPFALLARANSVATVDLAGDGRLPESSAYWTRAVVYDGPGVSAARVLAPTGAEVDRDAEGDSDAAGAGVAVTLGAPLSATRWLLAAGSIPGATGNEVIVANPGARDVEVRIEVLRNGERSDLPGSPTRLPAGAQVALDVRSVTGPSSFGLEVTAGEAVLVEHRIVAGRGLSVSLALPVAGTLHRLPPPLIDLDASPPGTGLPDIDLTVPGTVAPGTTAPDTTAPDTTAPDLPALTPLNRHSVTSEDTERRFR